MNVDIVFGVALIIISPVRDTIDLLGMCWLEVLFKVITIKRELYFPSIKIQEKT